MMKDYDKTVNKSIEEVKLYVLMLGKGKYYQDVEYIVNKSFDLPALRRNIYRRKDICLYMFNKIKRILDQCNSYDDLEMHLVYMNHIFYSSYRPVSLYQYHLFKLIAEQERFDLNAYRILRHLIKFNVKSLDSFIEYMAKRCELSEERYHYIALKIHVKELNFNDAYIHMDYISIDEGIKPYLDILYAYNPMKYKRHCYSYMPSLSLAM